MIETFYTALNSAQAWFFGSLLQDAFFAMCVQIFNSFILFAMFYSVMLYPIKWIVNKFIGVLDRV